MSEIGALAGTILIPVMQLNSIPFWPLNNSTASQIVLNLQPFFADLKGL
jgi:hypothetical protein